MLFLHKGMNEAILFFNSQGTPIKLPGVGTFAPSIDRNGKFRINFQAYVALKNGINAPGAYKGEMQRPHQPGQRWLQGVLGRRPPRRPVGGLGLHLPRRPGLISTGRCGESGAAGVAVCANATVGL